MFSRVTTNSRRVIVPCTRSFATATPSRAPLVIKNNRILASVIVSRAPQITRDSTPFEKAYFDYKEKLERQNATTFPTEFYFKKGSLAEKRWKEEEQARRDAMVDPHTSLTDATTKTQERLEKDDTSGAAAAIAMNKVEKASRMTKADTTNDIKSLDRQLQRTLYLVVHKPEDTQHPWQFPQGPMDSAEYLHEAAERQLEDDCGKDMDVWFVGRQPISFYKQVASKSSEGSGSKTFFMKARVYAGQVKPNKQVSDFAWVTKEELPNYLSSDYYNAIKDSLSEL
ncbi:39S mitochondrial ribosomal protein L46-domain-containing protein [Phascolomyces articulosus]|uniref:Large ribosomal subunit protein mL46 n=1 Tax=Phascolomyces articulosus TaxID=60185 RepID=A0AAD5PKY5_9FUNG|nr:39S mitochondrial ribosomal protein L46-domain-containing protein [Phascolomyces articulosus]